ncbi:hypothetical protein BpHYR1_031543 [Brachionus plicatilis]|uniref:Uncharacterized protein n=1 Tax=Brachionus plicatilis TaxID=10195 RepID=A0A3M7PWT1_BRAPC|nr:hypothetical protein BpHYR1_031543 [Brachionus plicatilis]
MTINYLIIFNYFGEDPGQFGMVANLPFSPHSTCGCSKSIRYNSFFSEFDVGLVKISITNPIPEAAVNNFSLSSDWPEELFDMLTSLACLLGSLSIS